MPAGESKEICSVTPSYHGAADGEGVLLAYSVTLQGGRDARVALVSVSS